MQDGGGVKIVGRCVVVEKVIRIEVSSVLETVRDIY